MPSQQIVPEMPVYSEVSDFQTLSLPALQEALNQRGVRVSCDALSQILSTGDIAEQLLIQTQGGESGESESPTHLEWRVPLLAVGALAAFFPRYWAAEGRLAHAPQMLHDFLVHGCLA